jgi:hypothetical protein
LLACPDPLQTGAAPVHARKNGSPGAKVAVQDLTMGMGLTMLREEGEMWILAR